MDFTDNPQLFIVEYFHNKKNQIDLKCEKAILESKYETEIKSLNALRMTLVEKIESVQQNVLQRYYALESKYTKDMLQNDNKQIKDEIFFDQYCLVLEFRRSTLFEFKLGLLLFTEYEDHVLEPLINEFQISEFRDVKYGDEVEEKEFKKNKILAQLVILAIHCDLNKSRSNIIYLEKFKWMKSDKIVSYKLGIDYSYIDDFAHKIKYMELKYTSLNSEEMKTDLMKNCNKFTSLENLKLILDYEVSIEKNWFYRFKNLIFVKLDGKNLQNLPEFIFASLTQLKELELFFNHNVKLNKNHFNGLENLHKLKVTKATLNEKLDFFFNLKSLELVYVKFHKFTFDRLESIESLILKNFNFTHDNHSFFDLKDICFENLKKLKFLEISNFDQRHRILDIEKKIFLKHMFNSISKNVEHFSTSNNLLEFFSSKLNVSPFVYQLRNLAIYWIPKGENFEKLELFHDDYLTNLESLYLECYHGNELIITTKQLKNMKNLKVLKMDRFILKGVDEEFNYLTEASFSIQLPDNISKFIHLKTLCLKDFYISSQVALNEQFLEDLVNLEELELISVLNSINPEVRYLFKSLTKLKKLTFTRNNIESVKSSYFDYLVNMEVLNLANNSIKSIEPYSFKSLLKLKYLNIIGNNFSDFKMDSFLKNIERLDF